MLTPPEGKIQLFASLDPPLYIAVILKPILKSVWIRAHIALLSVNSWPCWRSHLLANFNMFPFTTYIYMRYCWNVGRHHICWKSLCYWLTLSVWPPMTSGLQRPSEHLAAIICLLAKGWGRSCSGLLGCRVTFCQSFTFLAPIVKMWRCFKDSGGRPLVKKS